MKYICLGSKHLMTENQELWGEMLAYVFVL